MLQKSMVFFVVLLFSTLNYAATCPSGYDLQTNQLFGWQAFDRDNGTLLSSEQLGQFEKKTWNFALAEWMSDAPEGEAHCYYYGKDTGSDYLDFFLAKANLIPINDSTAWKRISADVMQCKGTVDWCLFERVEK